MKRKQGRVTFSVVGLGGRASVYLSALQELYPDHYAVAAIAEPPQILEPTPTKVEILDGTFIALCSKKETISDVAIVETIIGKDCLPVFKMVDKLSPNPKRITAYCRIFFDVKVIPLCIFVLSFIIKVKIIPIKIAKTGPPITGKSFPKSQEGTEIARHNKSPNPLSLIKVNFLSSNNLFIF